MIKIKALIWAYTYIIKVSTKSKKKFRYLLPDVFGSNYLISPLNLLKKIMSLIFLLFLHKAEKNTKFFPKCSMDPSYKWKKNPGKERFIYTFFLLYFGFIKKFPWLIKSLNLTFIRLFEFWILQLNSANS